MPANKDNILAPNGEPLFQQVLEKLPFPVFWKSNALTYLGANQALLDDFNVDNIDKFVGKSDFEIGLTQSEAEAFRKDDLEVIKSGCAKIGIEESVVVAGQQTRWVRTSKIPLLKNDGTVFGLFGTYEDITEQVVYRHTIEAQALIDPLTQLANRRELQNTILAFKGVCAGLFFIDLDHFKAVNDSLGHSIGDDLLQDVAARLCMIIPDTAGLVSRLGGDEFSIFLPLDSTEDAMLILEKTAQMIVNTVLEPFVIKNHIINLGASVGITIMTGNDLKYADSFREADMAMYFAKSCGRSNFKFFDDSMKKDAQRKNLVRTQLRSAIKKNELSLVYQPQINKSGDMIGTEALLRWNNAELGNIPPFEFILIAEETGLIHQIGMWVIETALDTLSALGAVISKTPDFKMAINVSSKQFQDKTLFDKVLKAIEARNLKPQNIQLEITETLMFEYEDIAIQTMRKFRDSGFSIAIDDFGTGYSSLSYLAKFPICKLKIDRSFVTELHLNSINRKLVGTMVAMSANLEMQVIAEGVETTQERDALVKLGCVEFQGYLYSRPVDASEIIQKYLP